MQLGSDFLRADFVDNLGVSDSFAVVGEDGVVVDNEECIGAVDAFAGAF